MLTRFLLKLALLGLPWLLPAFALLGIAWHTGEIVPVAIVAEWQQENPQLIYGKDSCDDILQYQLAAYEKRRPKNSDFRQFAYAICSFRLLYGTA